MLYHRRLDADWEAAADALRSRLAACEGLAGALTLAGRSRGQKLVLGPGHVTERLRVGARQLLYRQVGECGRCMPVVVHVCVCVCVFRQHLAALSCCTGCSCSYWVHATAEYAYIHHAAPCQHVLEACMCNDFLGNCILTGCKLLQLRHILCFCAANHAVACGVSQLE